MKRFDCLALDCPLFGSHLLEASAGTGKTFSIEHVFVRLVLEAIEIEQILVVTFTRAATRELKSRIRANLEKALSMLQSGEVSWEYLIPYLSLKEAVYRLSDALSAFDKAQIFTIHGFCYGALKEFSFESGSALLTNPELPEPIPDRLRKAAFNFLEYGIDESMVCSEQLQQLFNLQSLEEIVSRLVKPKEVAKSLTFSEIFDRCKAALHLKFGAPNEASSLGLCIAALHLGVVPELLLEDFEAIKGNYRVGDFGDLEAQVIALAKLEDPLSLRVLFKEKGGIFEFLDSQNLKIKTKALESFHYPGFFDWAKDQIAPLISQDVFNILQASWNPIAEKILEEEEHFGPDQILLKMKEAIGSSTFVEKVKRKYQAVIVDEFQDTDEVQWEIFKKLFVESPLRALYLVGDPKQSIYRFRKADIYTYLKAREFLGESNQYLLDTNYRSSKKLIGALNAIFNRKWLFLPSIDQTLPYHPVKAGSEIDSDFPDEKGALHFFMAEREPNTLFHEAFLPYVVDEIETLGLEGKAAILVKDRYQAESALQLCKERGIPAVAKSHICIGQTESYQIVKELFEAIQSPKNLNVEKVMQISPFANLDLMEARSILEEGGLVPFAKYAFKEPMSGDMTQILEMLFEWEREEKFSFEGLNRYLKKLKKLEADAGGRRRMEVDEGAVQILTIHISKGLEFEVVFALGLAARQQPTLEKEFEAEKLRQLYVAMTRAKKRLYVPFAISKKEIEKGTESPIELFAHFFDGSIEQNLQKLSHQESISYETIQTPYVLGEPLKKERKKEAKEPLTKIRPFTPIYLSSFSSLAKKSEFKDKSIESLPSITLQGMPRGTETGIVIHKIFEILFSSEKPIWRESAAVQKIVEKELENSFLEPWSQLILEMVLKTLSTPLQTKDEFFCLSDLKKDELQVEMEFLFSRSSDFVKGFIDLIFIRNGQVYFLDWKTNWLEDYHQESLEKAMKEHDYLLQASLYKEAVQRHFQMDFGGAFYFFVRGGAYLYV